jgi:elongation factor 2
MMDQNNIRNVSIIAHVDHGKTTLSDTILCAGGLVSEKDAGAKRGCDTRKDEQERGITIKSTGVTMHIPYDETTYKINLVDSPGHVDFSSEVTAALRITDGALVVVDSVEGPAVQTETVLRQAIMENIKPVLVINKMDRLWLELQETPEEIYERLHNIIKKVNEIIETYTDNPDLLVDPLNCNVAFTSAYFGWGFTLGHVAKFHSQRKGTNIEVILNGLWSPKGFCKGVIEPITQIYKCVFENREKLEDMMNKVGVSLTPNELALNDKKLFGLCLKKWLPLTDTLMYLITQKLPPPNVSQSYRVENLYTGPHDDECANAIKKCDPNGPLMVYISKMIPMDSGRFVAFGRIFSGTLETGMKVNVLGSNYDPDTKNDYFENKSIQRIMAMIGGKFDTQEKVECGNTCAIMGVDNYLVKTGTITDHPKAYPFHTMKFSVSPVVKVSVKPKNMSQIDKMVEGLNRLRKSDPCVLCEYNAETKEMTISATGELHMEICLGDLRDFMKDVEIVVSEPVVSFRESIASNSYVQCMAKSANKHNRVFMTAQNLSDELVNDIESGDFDVKMDIKERNKILVEKYGWDLDEARKIWCFGPEGINTCAFVDMTRGVQNIHEIKETCISAFKAYTLEGPLGKEQMRGVRFNIHDVMIHTDPVHRGGNQIMPMVRRAMYSSFLSAQPTLYEPLFTAEISVPKEKAGLVFGIMNKKRGELESSSSGIVETLKFTIPVAESFGLNGELRELTSGTAFLTLAFFKYNLVPGTIDDDKSKNYAYVKKIRSRKGLKEEMPQYTDYLDRL